MAMTFGYDYPPGQVHDRFVELAEQTASGVTTLFLPESTLINIFPFLMHIPPWVPGATTQKIAADIRKSLNGYRNEPFDYLKREVVRILSVLPRSQARERLRRPERRNHPCWQACYSVVGILKSLTMKYSRMHLQLLTLVCHPCKCPSTRPLTLDSAGVETVGTVTSFVCFSFLELGCSQVQSALSIVFFSIALHPAEQKRAQEEIDRVVGTERLPTFEDRESLPYVEAIWRESLRWRPALPQGNPHSTIADDEYNGYFFPKGTLFDFPKQNDWSADKLCRYSGSTEYLVNMVFPSMKKQSDK